MDTMSNEVEVKRKFPIDKGLLAEFKQQSKAVGKSYKQATKEAIQLWLEAQKER